MNDTITIVIETGNAAFENFREIPSILHALAEKGEHEGWTPDEYIGQKLLDVNGNVVGRVFGKLPGAPRV